MDLCDVSPGKPHNRGLSLLGKEHVHQYRHAQGFGFCECVRQILHFVTCDLAPVGIREIAIRHKHSELAKGRLDADPSVGVARTADFNPRRMGIVRHYLAMREREKTLHECRYTNWRNIDTILRDGLKRSVRRRSCVPIQLRIHAARPLDNRVPSDGIGKRGHEHVGAGFAGSLDRDIHILYEITGPFGAEWKGDWGLEPEEGDSANRSLDQLRGRAAGRRRDSDDYPLCAHPTKRSEEARYELVDILRINIYVGAVVLGPDGNFRCPHLSVGDGGRKPRSGNSQAEKNRDRGRVERFNHSQRRLL